MLERGDSSSTKETDGKEGQCSWTNVNAAFQLHKKIMQDEKKKKAGTK